MTIRPLCHDDLDTLIGIDQLTNPHPWNAMQWQDSLRQHLCLGLLHENHLIGFAVLMLLPDEAELLLIAVAPQWQGKGWGKALLDAVQEKLIAHQSKRLFLEVRESNTVARDFYLKAGLVACGRRKAYYPTETGREDALLYSLALCGENT